jgi:hypothetical protein
VLFCHRSVLDICPRSALLIIRMALHLA